MADHFEMATSLLVTGNILKDALDEEFKHRHKTPDVLVRITRLKADIKHVHDTAELHIGMAGVQATHDLRAVIEQLAKDLNAEPPPREPTCFLGAGRERHLLGCGHSKPRDVAWSERDGNAGWTHSCGLDVGHTLDCVTSPAERVDESES